MSGQMRKGIILAGSGASAYLARLAREMRAG